MTEEDRQLRLGAMKQRKMSVDAGHEFGVFMALYLWCLEPLALYHLLPKALGHMFKIPLLGLANESLQQL